MRGFCSRWLSSQPTMTKRGNYSHIWPHLPALPTPVGHRRSPPLSEAVSVATSPRLPSPMDIIPKPSSNNPSTTVVVAGPFTFHPQKFSPFFLLAGLPPHRSPMLCPYFSAVVLLTRARAEPTHSVFILATAGLEVDVHSCINMFYPRFAWLPLCLLKVPSPPSRPGGRHRHLVLFCSSPIHIKFSARRIIGAQGKLWSPLLLKL